MPRLSLVALLPLVGFSSVLAYTNIDADVFMYKPIDSLLAYGKYDSHMHTFTGSDAVTSVTTTSAELRKGCTSVDNPNDLSAYWYPTLYFTGNGKDEIVPMSFKAYYVGLERPGLTPLPEDLRLVAGNRFASEPNGLDPDAKISWACEGEPADADGQHAAAFPTKRCATHIHHLVWFPDCVNLDDLTQYSYGGTSSTAQCPEGQVRIPQMRFSIRYDARKFDYTDGPAPFRLSSGNSFSAHGDFINGFEPEAAKDMLLSNSKNEWRGVLGTRGAANCTPKDVDLNNTAADNNAGPAPPALPASKGAQNPNPAPVAAPEADADLPEPEKQVVQPATGSKFDLCFAAMDTCKAELAKDTPDFGMCNTLGDSCSNLGQMRMHKRRLSH